MTDLMAHFGVPAVPEALPNPYHGTRQFGGNPEFAHTWFHGTRGTAPDLRSGRPLEEGLGAGGKGQGWPQPNKLLGTHFTPLHRVAHRFAKGVYPSKIGAGSPGVGSALVHAQLHMRNPAHYPTEGHLNLAIAGWAQQHHPDWHDDELNKHAGWNWSDQEGTHRDFTHPPEYKTGGSFEENRGFTKLASRAQDLLQWHPKLPHILHDFTDDLIRRGHHGITYGNEVEGPGQGGHEGEYDKEFADHTYQDVRHISAIATRPSQIETRHVEHIAPPQTEPQAHEVEHHPTEPRYWGEDENFEHGKHGYASDANEPKSMYDRIGAFHAEHGGAYPHPGKEARWGRPKSEFAHYDEDYEDEDDQEEPGHWGPSEDYSQGWPGHPHQKKRRKKASADPVYYHGSAHRFKVGDLIEPGHAQGLMSSKEHVYFTPSESTARTFGGLSAIRRRAKSYSIYHVEPTGPAEPDPDSTAVGGYRSRHPLRVTKIHEHGSAPGDPDPWWEQPGTGKGYAKRASAAALYHGSLDEHPAGTVLTPEGRQDASIHSGDYVYATSDPEAARYFASQHDTTPLTNRDVYVHRVEPVGGVEPDDFPAGAEDKRFAQGNYRARALRVLHSQRVPGHYASKPALYHSGGKDFPGDEEWVHLGTREAAVNRAKDWHEERARRGAPPAQAYLHAVHLAGRHSPATETDAVANQPGIGDHLLRSGHTVMPYTNEYEDPGTVSYLAHRSAVSLLKTEPLAASKTASRERYVTCDQGHTHWGAHGAAFLLARHTDPDTGTRRYLLQKRTSTGDTDHGGTWALPGGALHEGEDSYAGARREAAEEMGPLPRMKHHHTVIDDHGGWHADTHVADAKERFQPKGGGSTGYEAEGHAWFDKDEIDDLKDKGALHPGFAATWDAVRRSRTDKTAAREPAMVS